MAVAAPPAPDRRTERGLAPLVFAVGLAGLGTEIAAARLMAPFFGASTLIWANTIAVELVALALGYWAGGALADRHPHARGLALLVVAAAGLLALVPLVAGPLLTGTEDVLSTFTGSLLGVLALLTPPIVILGAVAPWAIRLRLRSVEDAGEVAGRVYALSTAGSLAGTFLAALLLLPLIGTRFTFLAFAALLLLAALPVLREAR